MKKHIIAFGLAVSLLSFFSTFAAIPTPITTIPVSTQNFPSSGIDMDASTVTIGLSDQPAGAGTFTCAAGSLNTAITFTNAGWNESTGVFDNFSDSSVTPPINCFGAAGDYTLDIHLLDKAGNEKNSSESFTILPGTPTDSSLDGNCAGKVANNLDECEFTVVLKDQYGNETAGQSPMVHSPDKTFPYEANTKTGFRNGLQFDDGNGTFINLPTSATPITNNTFKIRAIVPSLVKVGTHLAKVISREIKFIISNIKEVNPDGTLGADIADLTSLKGLKFANPFAIKPSVGELELQENIDLSIETSRNGVNIATANGEKNIISIAGGFCDTDPKVETPAGSGAYPACDSDVNETLPNQTLTGTFPETNNFNIYFGRSDSDIIGTNSIAFVTKISYDLAEKQVSYPAGGIGGLFAGLDSSTIGLNTDNIDAKFIGADIEGFTSVDKDKSVIGIEGGEVIMNIGLNSAKTDVYEEIVKNGFALARNSANKFTNKSVTFAGLFSGTNSVAVVDLTEKSGTAAVLSISGQLPTGKKTLVLINGNLKITGNLTYLNKDDSFGVIVLRTEAGKEPTVGNIFVAPGVSKIAGSYFADGGFMDNGGNTIATGNILGTTQQLLLEGSLLSRNTLGGSLRQANYYTPWGTTTDPDLSRRYDLHFVRRYDPSAEHVGISGEPNTAAFIIRPDQKATILPPPGFKIQ